VFERDRHAESGVPNIRIGAADSHLGDTQREALGCEYRSVVGGGWAGVLDAALRAPVAVPMPQARPVAVGRRASAARLESNLTARNRL